jgi:quinol monooxygenase YgiN
MATMLVINGVLTIDPARRADLVAAALTMMAASQAEDGCHHYVFTADLERDDIFHISEKWTDQAALDAHFATAHMAAFRKAIAGGVKGSDIHKYEVSSESKM